MREDMTRELEGLIQGYLEETLTEEEARRLRELLQADERNLDEFIRAADLHGVLAGLRSELATKSGMEEAPGAASGPDERARAKSIAEFEERLRERLRIGAIPQARPPRFQAGKRLLKMASSLAAAAGLVLLGSAFTSHSSMPSENVGTTAALWNTTSGGPINLVTAGLFSHLGWHSRDDYDRDLNQRWEYNSALERNEAIRKGTAYLGTTPPSFALQDEPIKLGRAGSIASKTLTDEAGKRDPSGEQEKISKVPADMQRGGRPLELQKAEVEAMAPKRAGDAPAKPEPPPPAQPVSPADGIVRPPPRIPSADDKLPIGTAAVPTIPVEDFESRPAQENRKIVRNAEASIEVDSYEAAYAKLIALVAQEKGYVSDGDIQKMPNGKIQASVKVRIPAERFDAVLGRLKEFGTVMYQNIKSEDVTKDYFDHQARLKSKELLLERLKGVLKDAKGTAKELMEVEVQIGSTLESIDQIKGELRYYDTVVSMSLLILGLVEKDLAQPFEYVQTLQSNLGLTARDADDAYARAQKEITDAGGQVVDSRMDRQNDGTATGTIRARVAAEKFPALREALRKLGHVTNDTVSQQKTARGGQEGAPKPDAPLKKEQAVIDLSIATPPLLVTRRAALLVESLSVQESYPAARKTVEAAGGKVTSGSLTGRDAGTQAMLTAEIDAEKFTALVESLKTAGKLKDSRVRLDLPAPTPDGQPALLRERAEIELTLVSPAPLIDDEHGIGRTLRDTFAGSWKGVLWSVEKLFVGLSLAGPWLGLALVGWVLWRRVRKKKTATP
jgi:hypothetical protein